MVEQIVTSINGYCWSAPLIIFICAVGLYFSIRTRFLQIRHVKEMVGYYLEERGPMRVSLPFKH